MREWTETHREGTNVGPVDWDHPIAKDMPGIWREAEKSPNDFVLARNDCFNTNEIIEICMYDGWPYWKPMPAICFIGPLGAEWNFFNSYGINANSIQRKVSR